MTKDTPHGYPRSVEVELPGMPAPETPRKGSAGWKRAEWKRFRYLSLQHDGLTTTMFAQILLGVSRQRVHQLTQSGHLPSVEVLGRTFLFCDELERFARLERDSAFRYDGDAVAA